jgi:prepilin-type N-terminal cleavage/methylation domain-containing protein
MLQNIKKRNEGFTIIEVLIVLAIAGLILVIVFLAVPNLQRSQRNTGRKSDASRITTAASTFLSNNGGNPPSTAADALAVLKEAGTLGQLAIPQTAAPTVNGTAAPGVFNLNGALPTPAVDNVATLHTNATCAYAAGNASFGVGTNPREMALIYSIEGNSGFTWGCLSV